MRCSTPGQLAGAASLGRGGGRRLGGRDGRGARPGGAGRGPEGTWRRLLGTRQARQRGDGRAATAGKRVQSDVGCVALPVPCCWEPRLQRAAAFHAAKQRPQTDLSSSASTPPAVAELAGLL